ncbi:conserved hypothetical protein [Candidatus Sulfotelmatobacter kueseliae]|uniref:Uncharacterized protein n=1 Tax=Candidatus Sulfotelmatobacter kueseliae TaxID=2042962 RepID=A0A2U3L870_9BACT|nr:conserved hypothetical protein [Candidatus Sulfotelmatobacter kueseliae]
MRGAVYNSAIPEVALNPVNRASRSAPCLRVVLQLFIAMFSLAIVARAADWSGPEQQLARKIVAVTGPGAAALTIENHSSLGRRDSEIIQNGLRSELEGLGLRLVKAEQAAATVTITLSENAASYVWVAEIRQGAGETAVVMVSAPRSPGAAAARDSVPLSLRKIPLWTQDSPILDVAVLEENVTPTHIAVLDSEKVALYRWQGGKWEQEQTLAIVHERPWPRDLRGRLIPARDHLLDAYLPGVICISTAGVPLALSCRESDDPWPLVAGTLNGGTLSVFPSAGLANGAATVVPQVKAFFAPTRNFFTGALTPGVGKFTTVPKFYSAALLPRDKYTLWLFAATDGQVHLVDGVSDQTARLGWGSELASVRTQCGAGWQVLAPSAGEQAADSVRAYEFPDRDPVAVSAPIDLPGAITALWTEARGDTAVVVVRDQEAGSYASFRLAVACSQ